MQAEFLSLGSEPAVTQLIEKQLSNYNYTFPRAPNVSMAFSKVPANILSEQSTELPSDVDATLL